MPDEETRRLVSERLTCSKDCSKDLHVVMPDEETRHLVSERHDVWCFRSFITHTLSHFPPQTRTRVRVRSLVLSLGLSYSPPPIPSLPPLYVGNSGRNTTGHARNQTLLHDSSSKRCVCVCVCVCVRVCVCLCVRVCVHATIRRLLYYSA